MKSSRKKHKGTKIRFFDGELEESNHSFEQKYIQKQLEPNIWYLNKKGISADNYQNFVGQLKSHGVKAPEQSTLIATFIQFMSDQDGGHKYDFLSIRGCNKSNNYVRNVVFNRISLEFPDEFLRILKEFLDQQQNVKEKQNLIDKFIDYSKILLLISENYLKNQKNDLELSNPELTENDRPINVEVTSSTNNNINNASLPDSFLIKEKHFTKDIDSNEYDLSFDYDDELFLL